LQLRTNTALSRAAHALRSARQALADLDKRDRESLWWPIHEVEGGSIDFSNGCWASPSRPDHGRIAAVDVRAR
jgi:hypothetical protein